MKLTFNQYCKLNLIGDGYCKRQFFESGDFLLGSIVDILKISNSENLYLITVELGTFLKGPIVQLSSDLLVAEDCAKIQTMWENGLKVKSVTAKVTFEFDFTESIVEYNSDPYNEDNQLLTVEEVQDCCKSILKDYDFNERMTLDNLPVEIDVQIGLDEPLEV